MRLLRRRATRSGGASARRPGGLPDFALEDSGLYHDRPQAGSRFLVLRGWPLCLVGITPWPAKVTQHKLLRVMIHWSYSFAGQRRLLLTIHWAENEL